MYNINPWLRILLSPFALIYYLVTAVRNKLYDWGIVRVHSYPELDITVVGNITTGGTGKTPMIEALIRKYQEEQDISSMAVISRGYHRKSKGLVVVQATHTPEEVGDEPLQIKQKFPEVTVVVDGNRNRAVRYIIENYPNISNILLDDGFQHRSLKANNYIILADYNRPLYKDYILPMGSLRESVAGLKRATSLVITKVPDRVSKEELEAMRARYLKIHKLPISFAKINYTKLYKICSLQGVDSEELKNTPILALSGIGNPMPFESYLQTLSSVPIQRLRFPDHYAYSLDDLQGIVATLKGMPENTRLITTEKDATRLRPLLGGLGEGAPLREVLVMEIATLKIS